MKLLKLLCVILLFCSYSSILSAAPNNVNIFPSNDGYYNTWLLSGAASKSSAVGIDDGDSSYIYTNTSGMNQTLTVPSTTVANGEIDYIQIVAKCYGDDSASYLIPRIKIDGNQYTGNKRYNKTANWTTHYFDFYLNPKTGSKWKTADIPLIQEIGFGIYTLGSGKTVRCSYLYVSVIYKQDVVVPVVSSVNITGNVVSILGSNFKSNNMKHEFLGNEIESMADDTPFVNSNNSQDIYTSNYAKIYSGDKHSGNKSIRFKWTDVSGTGSAILKDFGEGITEAYMTAWIKINHNDDHTTFQWKNWRIKNSPIYNAAVTNEFSIIGDTWYINGKWGNADVVTYHETLTEPDGGRAIVPDAFVFGEWQRVEAYYKKSTPGQEDGIYKWTRIGRPINSSIADHRRVITHPTEEAPSWRYILWGHYYGNLSGGTYRDMEIMYDDVYFAQTRARVELGNDPIYDNCTVLELQPVSSWTDSSIACELNLGNSNIDTLKYLFVIDSDGVISNTSFIVGDNLNQTKIIGTKTVNSVTK